MIGNINLTDLHIQGIALKKDTDLYISYLPIYFFLLFGTSIDGHNLSTDFFKTRLLDSRIQGVLVTTDAGPKQKLYNRCEWLVFHQ